MGEWSSASVRSANRAAGVYAAAMSPIAPLNTGWNARLDLGFERRGARTELVRRQHKGPLVVQKALHPEGDSPCHAIVLHPPSGLVGGDALALGVDVGAQAHALITTPGATKWYRSLGAVASSETRLRVDAGGALEFLPREAIVFDGAAARAALTLELASDARLLTWDTWCLGRTHSGERFERGRLELSTRLMIAGREVLVERGVLHGGSALLASPAGLAGAPVFATMLAVGAILDSHQIADCRALTVREGRGGLTQLPEVLCARYLGHSTEAAHDWFVALWERLRPLMLGRVAHRPRIWAV